MLVIHPTPQNFLLSNLVGTPEENIFIKNTVALHFYAEDNCMFSVIKNNLFIHLKKVSNVLSFALHVMVLLVSISDSESASDVLSLVFCPQKGRHGPWRVEHSGDHGNWGYKESRHDWSHGCLVKKA